MTNLIPLISVLLAVSLAAERLVTILKTAIKPLSETLTDPFWERVRMLAVQFISFGACYLTVYLMGDAAVVSFGDKSVPAVIIAALSMGGSSFWSNILGYVKAAKETKQQAKPVVPPPTGVSRIN